MKIQGIICNRCGDTIYSRAIHDYRHCTCKAIAIDGGLDYHRVSWCVGAEPPESCVLDIEVSKEVLYHDWNMGMDRYGLIKKEEHI